MYGPIEDQMRFSSEFKIFLKCEYIKLMDIHSACKLDKKRS